MTCLVVVIAGAGLAVQMAWNARLRLSTNSPVLTTIISLVVSIIPLVFFWVGGAGGRGSIPALDSLPKWAWLGGVFAAFYLVAALIAIPKLGAGSVFSLVIVGQVVAALFLDSTGFFGITRIPLNGSRVLGTLLLIFGVVLIQKNDKTSLPDSSTAQKGKFESSQMSTTISSKIR